MDQEEGPGLRLLDADQRFLLGRAELGLGHRR